MRRDRMLLEREVRSPGAGQDHADGLERIARRGRKSLSVAAGASQRRPTPARLSDVGLG